jgi:hypothetical protein
VTSFSWSDLLSYVPILLNGGVAGIWIVCWLKGWVASPREITAAERSAAEWKALYLAECEAHSRTREAYQTAGQRAQAAVDMSQLVAGALTAVQASREIPPSAAAGR